MEEKVDWEKGKKIKKVVYKYTEQQKKYHDPCFSATL